MFNIRSIRRSTVHSSRLERCARGLALAATLALGIACSKSDGDSPPGAPAPPDRRDPLEGGPYPTLLLAKAQFEYHLDAQGRRRPVPGPAKLVMLRSTAAGWREVVIEDHESKVFHKALQHAAPSAAPGLLTIGGTAAALKHWDWRDGAWTPTTLWNPQFGGRWDRLRDIEIGDVTGDGVAEMVVATHDQGVVGVLRQDRGSWTATEIDRAARTFVHEIEIGDADGDGVNEFFATPSQPNTATLASQPGSIVMYRWSGDRFVKSGVATFAQTHAKEILALNLAGERRTRLWAAVEAQTEKRGASLATIQPVEIREFLYDGAGWSGRTIATLEDTQCRVLVAGDLDGDGAKDVVATGMRSGVWWLRQGADGAWVLSSIDRQSSGFEHAALIADVLGTGRDELFVAADEQGELRRYRWNGQGFDREVIAVLPRTEITFQLGAGTF